jgi:hypothetical protein
MWYVLLGVSDLLCSACLKRSHNRQDPSVVDPQGCMFASPAGGLLAALYALARASLLQLRYPISPCSLRSARKRALQARFMISSALFEPQRGCKK